MKTAFIIIDVQNILVETGFETQKLLEKISYLQDQARKQQIEIIYIQHIETEEALTLEIIATIKETVWWKGFSEAIQ